MKAKELKQDKRNYRKHSGRNKELIRKSVDECGLGRSVLVDADGVLIAGNGVHSVIDPDTPVRVVETDGSELVVVKRTDLREGDERRRKLALADNATADRVEWDFDSLSLDFDDSFLEGWDISLDFDIPSPDETGEASEDDFDETADKVEPICKLGDLWQLGEHCLMCGDSTKAEDVAKLMNGEQADLWLTDPPYNVDYQGGTADALKIKNDNMSDANFLAFLTDAFKAAYPNMKAGCAFYILTAQGHNQITFSNALDASGKVKTTTTNNEGVTRVSF